MHNNKPIGLQVEILGTIVLRFYLLLIKLISRLISSWTDHWSAWINCSSWAGRLPQLDWKHLDPPPRPETRRSKRLRSYSARDSLENFLYMRTSLCLSQRGRSKKNLTDLRLCLGEREKNYGAQGLEILAFHLCPSVAPWVEKQSFL